MHQIKQIVKRILEIKNIFKTWSCSVLRRPLDKLYEGYFQSSLQAIQTFTKVYDTNIFSTNDIDRLLKPCWTEAIKMENGPFWMEIHYEHMFWHTQPLHCSKLFSRIMNETYNMLHIARLVVSTKHNKNHENGLLWKVCV